MSIFLVETKGKVYQTIACMSCTYLEVGVLDPLEPEPEDEPDPLDPRVEALLEAGAGVPPLLAHDGLRVPLLQHPPPQLVVLDLAADPVTLLCQVKCMYGFLGVFTSGYILN